ncbi:MAG: M24 family metallopeptidase [Ilumatobacteraceae bacterium]
MHASADRLAHLGDHLLQELHVDSILITAPSDVRWASGFGGSVASLVVGSGRAVLVVDSRYGEQAIDQSPECEVVVANSVEARSAAIGEALRGAVRVGFDEKRTTYAEWRSVRSTVTGELVPLDGPLNDLRACKDESEILRIESAARAADLALAEVVPGMFGGGMTERDVRDELERCMRRHGADGPAYPTIVASGPNSALPHHQPTDRPIREGDSVIVDVGALVDGYRSDMTRTFFMGDVDPILITFHEILRDTQRRVMEAVSPGASAADLDAVARSRLADHSGDILHSTGHGVGLDIHESPWLRSGSRDVLRVGNVVTVEPGLYRVGIGGVRIEDLLLVEPAGSRTLTTSPKDPSCPQSAPTT